MSPLVEVFHAFRAVGDRRQRIWHEPWLAELGHRLRAPEFAPLAALVTTGRYAPDFLSPPPGGRDAEVGEELARVRATDEEQVRRELQLTVDLGGGSAVPSSWLANPALARDDLADLMARAWEAAIQPRWPTIRALLAADIEHRAARQAASGLPAALADLHRDVGWSGRSVLVAGKAHARRELDEHGLLLLPSVFTWPGCFVVMVPPWQPAVIYPARGVGTLWQAAPSESTSDALAKVVGLGRARILSTLDLPASTTGIAARLEMAPATVSEHLSALRGAGLVSTRRVGREVRYARTDAAVTLLAAAGRVPAEVDLRDDS